MHNDRTIQATNRMRTDILYHLFVHIKIKVDFMPVVRYADDF